MAWPPDDPGPGPGKGSFAAAGAVLSGSEIETLCKRSEGALISPFRRQTLKPAAYDVVIAKDGMITPDEQIFRPGEECSRPLILEPGDTAFVSTWEKFNMPGWLTGTISIKASLARQGVLLLTGLVVDPHYRETEGNDGRLHFTLANLGGAPVVIEPHHTPVVTIQFVRTSGYPHERAETSVTNIWSKRQELAQMQQGLGFIAELRNLKNRLLETRERLESQSTLTQYALIAGLFLLATTILGVSAASILSAASDHKVVTDVKTAIPESPGKRVFLMVMALAVAWIVFSLSQALVRIGSRSRESDGSDRPMTEAHSFIQHSAIASLRVDRLLAWTAAGVVVFLLTTGLVEGAIAIGDVGAWWWAIPAVISVLALAGAWLVQRFWKPIKAREINARVAELYEQSTAVEPSSDSRAPTAG